MRGTEIQEVFLNILTNALDALEERDKKDIHINVHHEGEFVVFTIADSGCGIVSENIGKIFDPFFTTKPVGKGTGLGLSICQSIIKEHGGEIIYESVLGVGTIFKITLPIERRKYKEKAK